MTEAHENLDLLSETFQARLTLKESQLLKVASYKDLLKTICGIQSRQDTQRELRNMTRIKVLHEALIQLEHIAGALSDRSEELEVVWGCIKFVLQTSSANSYSFDRVLECYEQIGDAMPSLYKYQKLVEQDSDTRKLVFLLYEELLNLQYRIFLFFSEPSECSYLYHVSY